MRETVMKDGHHVQLLHRGAMFFPALIAAIDRSTVEVRLETYIFSFDTCGEQVAHALVRAAKRGVAVYVLMDAIGTDPLPAQWVAQLKAAGVRWQRFSPLGRLGLLIPGRWRRLHRKLCVVDGHTGFCGGINIQDDFFDLHHGPQDVARLDYAGASARPLGGRYAPHHGSTVGALAVQA
jgi:cardiolipin synthase A/B